MAKDKQYVGNELVLFAQVSNWNAYIKSEIEGYIRGHVLEVGAGIGGITGIFFTGREKSCTCLEPDKELFQLSRIFDSAFGYKFGKNIHVVWQKYNAITEYSRCSVLA